MEVSICHACQLPIWFHLSTWVTSSSEKNICIMIFRVAYWDIVDDSLSVYYERGKYFWAYWWQVSWVYILVWKRKIFLSILMVSVICVHFSQLINRMSSVSPCALCNIGMHFKTLLNKFMPRYEVNTLECQLSWIDTYGEVVNYQCNLAYALK